MTTRHRILGISALILVLISSLRQVADGRPSSVEMLEWPVVAIVSLSLVLSVVSWVRERRAKSGRHA